MGQQQIRCNKKIERQSITKVLDNNYEILIYKDDLEVIIWNLKSFRTAIDNVVEQIYVLNKEKNCSLRDSQFRCG